MEKVIRDGKVAVVVVNSSVYPGWYTLHGKIELVFHPEIVRLVEENRFDEIDKTFCQKILNTNERLHICSKGLMIEWLPQGIKFFIEEHDMGEKLIVESDLKFTA